MNNIYITIQDGESDIYIPVVKEGIKLTRTFGGVPSTLVFSAVKDEILTFNNGARVKLLYNDLTAFTGYIFEFKDSDDDFITVTCYDQLRYLKNKRSYNALKNKKASDIIKMIADDFQLNYKNITDTEHIVDIYISDKQTLNDLIYYYIYSTKIATGKLYELFDDGGELKLEAVDNMKSDYFIDTEIMAGYSYTSSIDKDTYNAIVLIQNKSDSADGKRKIFYKSDSENIKKWGRLEYTETLTTNENGNEKASQLLKRKNKETKSLTIKNAIGDIGIRGGSLVVCQLTLNGVDINRYMLVNKVTHKIENNVHFMDLVLTGGDFN